VIQSRQVSNTDTIKVSNVNARRKRNRNSKTNNLKSNMKKRSYKLE